MLLLPPLDALFSHISLGNVDLSKVSFFILDEADRMLDMGFSDDILTIQKKTTQNLSNYYVFGDDA